MSYDIWILKIGTPIFAQLTHFTQSPKSLCFTMIFIWPDATKSAPSREVSALSLKLPLYMWIPSNTWYLSLSQQREWHHDRFRRFCKALYRD